MFVWVLHMEEVPSNVSQCFRSQQEQSRKSWIRTKRRLSAKKPHQGLTFKHLCKRGEQKSTRPDHQSRQSLQTNAASNQAGSSSSQNLTFPSSSDPQIKNTKMLIQRNVFSELSTCETRILTWSQFAATSNNPCVTK